MSGLREVSERVDQAIQALADIRATCDYDGEAYRRLTAKIDGLALAGSYLGDEMRLDATTTRAHTAADEFATEFGHAHPWVAKIRALGDDHA